ncbi:aminotransferase [Jannaschia pagri]|uniref:Aminotransferase n=1 Tax=Jannaschia pagri TaxID=2829797 RepID=A0ABQ4NNH6_9RHOB|nr:MULTISPECIES: aminotransferase class I/II-fold pyridoxal phosphate-dependent enzyme [unclassified Jannaschia]GIT92133.1 aminotransferase [Jannaschia sp. AI_61]GIT95968.1 aminotransferase [Jannaschia sp. AI_62]
MVTLSNRLRQISPGGEDGWDIFNRARALEAQGIPLTDLTVGEHDIRTHPTILSAMAEAAHAGQTGYAATAGTADLRARIAARVSERTQVPTTQDNVLVVPGAQMALFTALMGALEPGDPVLIPDPYYATYPGTVRAAGGRPVALVTRPKDGFQPTRAALEAAGDARAVLVNSPNNPTGAVYGPETMHALADAARDRDAWLISDEVYDTQVWTGAHQSPRALPHMADRTLVAGSLSKSHAMTGSRLGWLIGPADAIAEMATLATYTTYGVPGYIQAAGCHALSLGAAFEAEISAPFLRRRQACLDRLDRQQVVRAIPSGGAMYLMLDIRGAGLSAPDFAARLLDQHRIAVMPGDSFGRAAAGHIRVALTLPETRLLPAFDIILSFAEEMRP